jgi:hypothetical protein
MENKIFSLKIHCRGWAAKRLNHARIIESLLYFVYVYQDGIGANLWYMNDSNNCQYKVLEILYILAVNEMSYTIFFNLRLFLLVSLKDSDDIVLHFGKLNFSSHWPSTNFRKERKKEISQAIQLWQYCGFTSHDEFLNCSIGEGTLAVFGFPQL